MHLENEVGRKGMKHYPYLIVGGGMTAAAAVEGIREVDRDRLIGMISAEPDAPYNRPPLSKGLWKGKPLDRIWRKTEDRGVELILDCEVKAIDPTNKQVTTEDGEQYGYDRLLLATGGRPKMLPFGGGSIIYFRTLRDYRRLRQLAEQKQRFAVIGGGCIGSEIAAALAMNGKQVSLVIRSETVGGPRFPREAGDFLNELYRRNGVDLLTEQVVTDVERKGDQYRVATHPADDHRERELRVDAVVAGIGLLPNVELAQAAGLYVNNGIWVDELLRTSHPDIYAAGDVASFHNPALGRRLRVEHEDNANVMGRAAGRNVAGAAERYHYLPYFYSDLFDVGYEAVGETEADAEQVVDWQRPLQEGTIYYLKRNRVRGVLFWNSFGHVDRGRELIAGRERAAAGDLVNLNA